MPTYRTAGPWGSGSADDLDADVIDNNFYELRTDLDTLIANPPTANSIETIEAEGFTWRVTLTDGTELAPLPVPVVYTVWRGEWAPLTLYSAADLFSVAGEGIFAVLQDHTSAATFDPDAAGGSPLAPFYLQLIGVGTNTTFADLADVTITGVADDDLPAWDAGSGQWTNRTPAQIGALVGQFINLGDLGDVADTAPTLGQVLTWAGSPATWQPQTLPTPVTALDDLSDVSVPSPGDGDVLTYQAGSPTGWIAAAPAAIPSALDDLTDVVAPGPADGDLLQFDGTDWINAAGEAVSDLTDATLPLVTASYLEISEPAGSPAVYTSKKITAADLLALANIAGLGAGVATFLATPSSANLAAAVTGETGSGALVFGTSPTIAAPTFSGTIAGTYTIGGTPTLGVALTLPGSGQISSGGKLGLGAAPAVTDLLAVALNATGNTTNHGVNNSTAILSDVTGTVNVFRSAPSTQAAAFTLGTLRSFLANGVTIGAGSAVATQYGFMAASTITGATTNYGFYSDIASGTGRWNFYAAGTAPNLFGGMVQFSGATASFPALKRSTTTIQARLADDSGYASLDALSMLDGGVAPSGTAGSGYLRATGATASGLTLTGTTTLPGSGSISTTGVITTGVTGSKLLDQIFDQHVAATAQLDKTSDTTLAAVTGMSVTLVAGKTYILDGWLSTTAGASGGLKVALVASGGLTITSGRYGAVALNGTTTVANTTVTALGSNIVANTAVITDVEIGGTIVVNAGGTLTVQAAQNANNATTTSVFVNSHLMARRIN